MSFYKKMVSVCAAVALSTSIIPVIPVSADTGMTRYEAERQYTGGWADVVQNSIASGGYVVERIGGKSTDIGTVVFKIWAEEAGTYNAKLGYISKKDSDFYVRVNWYAWDTGNDTKFTTTASNSVQTQEMTLKLNAGWNDVKIYSTKGITDDGTDYRISVDYLDVDTEGYTLPNITEDTKATLNNTSHRDIYKASDGSGITGLGQSGSADFIVKADEDGAYNLGIWYSSADYRALEVYADNVLVDTVYCPVTNESDRIDTAVVQLTLTAGEHKITFKNQYGQAPDIDKIQLKEAENNSESNTENINLLGINTEPPFTNGIFSIDYNLNTGKADYKYGSDIKVSGFESVVKVEDSYDSGDGNMINTVVKSSDYTDRYVTYDVLNDGFGQGALYTVVNQAENLPTMYQKFYVYKDMPYALVQVELGSDNEISTNFMAPISTSGENVVDIGTKTDARALFVPFSNDGYTAYNPETLNGAHTSYFVTAIFDNNSRNSVIAGSVDHDTWKTGTSTWATADNGNINFFGAFAGINSKEFTYDFQPHGSIKGTKVSSPKMFLGYFDDWRDGMETYGDANKRNNGKLSWGSGSIFGFSSWNAHQDKVTLENMKNASDEMATLNAGGFCDENGITWVNIDSYYDNLIDNSKEDPYTELKEYVEYAHNKGLKVGLYNARHVLWDNDMQGWGVRDSAITDEYGNPVALAKTDSTYGVVKNSIPIDPTSDHFKNDVKNFMSTYTGIGFDYLKIDFLNFCTLEGNYADSSITTGMQAYNALCKEFTKYIDPEKFFLNYSIAPLFPSQYAHSRRLSCDIGTEKSNSLEKAKYMLNALQYGWWQDGNLYEYTDPDQISFYVPTLLGFDTDTARGKYTSGVIAGGVMLLSNDFSSDKAKSGVESVAMNERINDVVRIGKAFRPTKATSAWNTPYENDKKDPDNVYYMEDNGYTYVAVFNFDSTSKTKEFNLADVGLNPTEEYSAVELWDNSSVTISGDSFTTNSIAARSANLYKIESGADTQENGAETLFYEDFDTTGTTTETITSNSNGWTFGTWGDTAPFAQIGGFCGRENSLRLSAGNSWWTSGYVNVNLAKAGAAQKSISEDEINEKLSKDITLSFKVNFDIPNPEQAGYNSIRIKDKNGNVIVQIQTPERSNNENGITDKLKLTGVKNPDGSGDNLSYTLKDPINNVNNNTEWYEIAVNFDMTNSKYRVSVDGQVLNTDEYGEWIESSTPLTDNIITDLYMEVYSAAWYQSMHFDDIKVVSAADDVEFNVDAEIKNTIEDRDEIWPGDILDYTLTSSGGTIDNDKTEVSFAYRTTDQSGYTPITDKIVPEDAYRIMMVADVVSEDGNTVRRIVYADVEPYDRTYYNEDFDNDEVYENIKNTADGWSISGNTGNINSNNDIISQSNGMLRFYTDKYWNQFWLDKDITSAVKMKYTKDGLSDSTAEVNIAKKLGGNFVVSFKAGFQQGDNDNGNNNEYFIRLNGKSGNILTQIHAVSPNTDNGGVHTVYLSVDGTDYKIAEESNSDMNLRDYKFVVNEDGTGYKLYIDGTQFTDTSYGDGWILANMSELSKLSLGIFWTSWYQTIWFDDFKIEPIMYDIDTSQFVGGTVETIRSRQSTDTAEAGNRIFVKVTPNKGYRNILVESLKVNGTEIGENGMFIMPNETAVITGAFKENPKKLATPAGLTFINGKAEWNTVENADGYVLQLYKKSGEEYTAEGEPINIAKNTTEYEFSELSVGDYAYKVKAIGDGDNFSDSDEVQSEDYRQTKKLATPQIVLFENGKAKWNSVDNAQSYSVRVYKYDKAADVYTAVGETVQGITATEYDCNITEVGTYSVHVRAESSSEYYTQGDIACSENNGMTYKYMVNLAPPASASISGSGIAQWEAVENALGYDIQLYCKTEDGGEPLGKVYRVNADTTQYVFDFETDGKYYFTVKTVGDEYYIASEKTTESNVFEYIQKPPVNAPENLEISINNDGRTLNVSWGAVSDSEGYMIRLYKKTDNEESDDIMTDTKMINNAAQTECEFVLSAKGVYYVSIIALGNGQTSDKSKTVTSTDYEHNPVAQKLDVPESVTFNNGKAEWSMVEGAEGYRIQLYKNGKAEGAPEIVRDRLSLDFEFSGVGGYTYKITALGDGLYYSDSYEAESNEYVISAKLEMPVLLGFSDGKASWRAVANAQGYKIQLYKDGTAYGKVISVESDILNCDMMEYIDSKGVYTYTVTTIGDGKYYTDSDESAQSVGYNYEPGTDVVQLPAPSEIKFEKGIATWTSVAHAEKYELKLYRDNSLLKKVETELFTYDFTAYIKKDGKYYYTITSIGNGEKYTNSETVQSEVYNYKASDDNNDDKTEPEWGVKSFNLNKQTGNFNITVTAGKERYPDTKIYVALYRNGVLVSVKSFVPEFDSNSEYSGDGTMSLPSDMTNISAKAFIWHGEMVPITEAIQLSIK